METKNNQLLASAAENHIVAAENICKYIEDTDEKKKHLDDLRELSLEHAKLTKEFDLRCKAVSYVSQKLKEIKDLEIERVNFTYLCSRSCAKWKTAKLH